MLRPYHSIGQYINDHIEFIKNMLFIASIIILVCIILLCLLTLVILIVLLYTRVPFVRTPKEVVQLILREVKISAADTVYDLGCGDAELLITAEKKFGVKTVGFETSPFAWQKARFNIAVSRSKTKLVFKNLFNVDLAPADIIYCFLVPTLMPRLAEKLKKELKSGTKVISYAYPLPNWTPLKTVSPLPNSDKSSKIYIYEIAESNLTPSLSRGKR